MYNNTDKTLKKYCFTEKEMQAIIDYFQFAIEKDLLIDKDDFIKLFIDDITNKGTKNV